MLKGLALTPPVVGRISIGKVLEKNGKRLPEKDDEFTLTSQVQSRGTWVLHPLDETLRKASSNAKLRTIPIKLLFDDPDLNLRARYTLFDRHTGRPLCVGDGQTCKRVGARPSASGQSAESLPCEGPDFCAYAQGQCKAYGRLNVQVGDEDELGTFVFRTTGFNSIRTLATRQRYLQAVSGGLLSNLPLELRLRGKSTTMSHRTPIYYVDLTLRSGTHLAEAMKLARAERQSRGESGWNQVALDQAAREGFACGVFEESEEDGASVLEEFYPEDSAQDIASEPDPQSGPSLSTVPPAAKSSLRDKLGERVRQKALVTSVSRFATSLDEPGFPPLN